MELQNWSERGTLCSPIACVYACEFEVIKRDRKKRKNVVQTIFVITAGEWSGKTSAKERERGIPLYHLPRREKKDRSKKVNKKKEEKATRLATLSLGQIVKGSIHSSLSSLHPVLYHIHVRDCNKNTIFFSNHSSILPQSVFYLSLILSSSRYAY